LELQLWVVMQKLVTIGMKYTKCSSLCHKDERCSITASGACDYLEKEMYGIQVVFNERGYWSKPYTYMYEKPIAKGSVVLVPTNNFFSVGKVIDSVANYAFKPDIKYKSIKSILEV